MDLTAREAADLIVSLADTRADNDGTYPLILKLATGIRDDLDDLLALELGRSGPPTE